MSVVIATEPDDALGEGPVWDDDTGTLTWVDIRGRRLHRWHPDGPVPTSQVLPDEVSLALPRRAGGHVVGQVDHLALHDGAHDSRLEPWVRIDADNPHTRLNDGCVDDDGVLWVGTYSTRGEPETALYRVAPDGTVTTAVDGLVASNGVAWSPDGDSLLLTDTGRATVSRYRLDDGVPRHEATLLALPGDDGRPDGLVVDAEGAFWTAVWGGGRLLRVDPDGEVLAEIRVPVTFPTSVALGAHPDHAGPVLYVTTSRHHLAPDADEPMAGQLLAVPVEVPGLPTRRCAR